MLESASFHPFALMVDPTSVFQAVEASIALGGLQSRVFRPLERADANRGADDELAAYDAQVDATAQDDVTDDTDDGMM